MVTAHSKTNILSVTDVVNFMDCPRRAHYYYLEKQKPSIDRPLNAGALIGTLVHRGYELAMAGRALDFVYNEIGDHCDRSLSNRSVIPVGGVRSRSDIVNMSIDLTSKLIKHVDLRGAEGWEAEKHQEFNFEFDDVSLCIRGRPDYVRRWDDRLEIVDLKVHLYGRPTYTRAYNQLMIYSMLYSRHEVDNYLLDYLFRVVSISAKSISPQVHSWPVLSIDHMEMMWLSLRKAIYGCYVCFNQDLERSLMNSMSSLCSSCVLNNSEKCPVTFDSNLKNDGGLLYERKNYGRHKSGNDTGADKRSVFDAS